MTFKLNPYSPPYTAASHYSANSRIGTNAANFQFVQPMANSVFNYNTSGKEWWFADGEKQKTSTHLLGF